MGELQPGPGVKVLEARALTFQGLLEMRQETSKSLKVKIIHLPIIEKLGRDIRL